MKEKLIRWLNDKYADINKEYVEECAIDFMSRRATYLDGQLAILHRLMEEVYDYEEEKEEEEGEPIDADFIRHALFDDVDETNYNPYMGCEELDY